MTTTTNDLSIIQEKFGLQITHDGSPRKLQYKLLVLETPIEMSDKRANTPKAPTPPRQSNKTPNSKSLKTNHNNPDNNKQINSQDENLKSDLTNESNQNVHNIDQEPSEAIQDVHQLNDTTTTNNDNNDVDEEASFRNHDHNDMSVDSKPRIDNGLGNGVNQSRDDDNITGNASGLNTSAPSDTDTSNLGPSPRKRCKKSNFANFSDRERMWILYALGVARGRLNTDQDEISVRVHTLTCEVLKDNAERFKLSKYPTYNTLKSFWASCTKTNSISRDKSKAGRRRKEDDQVICINLPVETIHRSDQINNTK